MASSSRYTHVQLESEAELENLLAADPTAIEPGMRLVARQWKTRRGPLDLLLLDQDGRVVVAELKVESDDDMLWQGLDYLAWVHENIDAIKRAFPECQVALDEPPRLLLIARSFSDALRTRAKYLLEEVQPTLLTYRVISHANEHMVVLTEVELAQMTRTRPEITRDTDHREHLVGDTLRSLWDRAAEYFKSLSPEVVVSPTHTYLGFRYKSRVIAALSAGRRGFWVYCYHDGEWGDNFKIAEAADFDRMFEALGPDYLRKTMAGRRDGEENP